MGLRGPVAKTVKQVWEELLQEAETNNKGCLLITKGHPKGIGYRSRRAGNQDWYVHHLADFIARGKAPAGTIRLHTCDMPNCINIEHIVRGTHADNVADKVAKNRHCFGVQHYRSKLSPKQVREIRASAESLSELSRIYGIGVGGIHNIKSGRSWKNLL